MEVVIIRPFDQCDARLRGKLLELLKATVDCDTPPGPNAVTRN
jgi:hypothetical protein